MHATRVLGAIFVVLVILEVIGLAILTGASASTVVPGSGGERSLALVLVAGAWIFGLWATLVAFMVFAIAWVAEGMSVQGHEIDARSVSTETPVEPAAATPAPERRELARAS